MAKKVLVVIDAQNDFVKGGALPFGYPKGKSAITDQIVARVKETLDDGNYVIATKDTHGEDYSETLEGRKLPVKHCIRGTEGWELVSGLKELETERKIVTFCKPTFGTQLVPECIRRIRDSEDDEIGEIEIAGFCTSICVLANAVMLRASFPNMKITVLEGLCGDIDEESHKAALKVLRNQQIEVEA